MARTVVPLTDPKCDAAKPREKDYKLFDGKGLYLLVKPTGVKTWRTVDSGLHSYHYS